MNCLTGHVTSLFVTFVFTARRDKLRVNIFVFVPLQNGFLVVMTSRGVATERTLYLNHEQQDKLGSGPLKTRGCVAGTCLHDNGLFRDDAFQGLVRGDIHSPP